MPQHAVVVSAFGWIQAMIEEVCLDYKKQEDDLLEVHKMRAGGFSVPEWVWSDRICRVSLATNSRVAGFRPQPHDESCI